MVVDHPEHAVAVPLVREGDVKAPNGELKQARQELRIIDVPAVRRVAIAAGAGMNADALSLLDGKPRQREVVQLDEIVQEIAGRVDLDRKTTFREVDLYFVRALPQAVADLRFVLAQQVVKKLVAGVAGNFL